MPCARFTLSPEPMPENEQDIDLASLLGNGEMARLLAAFDWEKSPVGPPAQWPAHFRVTLSNLLHNAFPMLLLWGPDLLVFYNDAYRPALGIDGRHPANLGMPARDAYAEVWSLVGPLLERVYGGETIFFEEQPQPFLRNGRMEEVLWTYSSGPVLDESGTPGGVLVVCSEVTQKVARFNNLLQQVQAAFAIFRGEELLIEEANPAMLRVWGLGPEVIGRPLAEVHTATSTTFLELLRGVYHSGEPYQGFEVPIAFRRPDGSTETFYFNFEYSPYRDATGYTTGVMALAYDVTQQALAKQERLILQDEMQSAITAADLGYWNVDPRRNTLSCNARTRVLFGLPAGDGEAVDLDAAIAAIDEADRERVAAAIRRSISNPAHSNYDIEYRVLHPDNDEPQHVRAIGKSYFDEDGKAWRFSGIIQDITPRKLAEEELRASEQRFGAAIDAVQGVVWTNNAEGRMQGPQPGWTAMTGQTEAEYRDFGWVSVVHPDDAQATVDAWKAAVREKQKFVFEHRLRRVDGSWGRYSVRAVPIFDNSGDIREWVGVHTDITEQRRSEEALRNSESHLRELADFMPQIVWSTDADGYHDFYNQRWYEYTGLNYEESKNEGWSRVLHPDDAAHTWRLWNHSLKTGAYYEVEYRMRRSDGQYRWLLARAMPVRDDEGRIVRWFGTCTDIHDRKSSTETLERLVAERTMELQRSNDDLQQFAHVASHDLKEPVRKIATFESRLSQEFADALPERAKGYLEKIRTASRRMYNMIEGVLRYSSLNDGEPLTDPVDLNEVINQIRSDLEVLISEKGARIEAEKLPVLKGSPTLLYQLFYNIINNALKFAAPDRPLQVRITAESLPGAARICIADNGIGFEPEHAAHIFKTFTRLHPKDRYEGTGLGLALCQKIVDRHGGSIRAEGREGEGATFIITLPAST
jgi:PAS domain S-box-containing protein